MTNKLNYILLSVIVCISMASCSLFSKKGNVVQEATSSESVTTQAPTMTTVTTSTTKVKDNPTSLAPYVPSALSGELNGEWVIVQVGTTTVSVDEDIPYVNFEENAQRFYANNGCNILNGQYEINGNQLTFSNVLSTMKACPDALYENAINKVLNEGVTVKAKIDNKGRESYLYLTNNSGKNLLTLRRHNMEILTGKWEVTNIEGKKLDNPELNIFIDIPGLKVHGNTGCNYFNGVIVIDPLVQNSIQFSQMGVTMRMCENIENERIFLVALEETHTYKLDSNASILKLLNSKGKTILTLKRVPLE